MTLSARTMNPPQPPALACAVRAGLAATGFWIVAYALASFYVRVGVRKETSYPPEQLAFDFGVVLLGAAHSLMIWAVLWRLARHPLWVQALAGAALTVALALPFEWVMRAVMLAVFEAYDDPLPPLHLRTMVASTSFWSAPFGLWTAGVLVVMRDAAARRQTARLAALRAAATAESPAESPPVDLWVQRRGEFVRLAIEDIDWIEADRDYARLHAAGESYLIRHTLGGLQEKLGPDLFLRVRRSALVRADRIAAIREAGYADIRVRLHSGDEVRVGRTYVRQVRALLGRGAG